MKYVRHRVNQITALNELKHPALGAEIDLRADLARPGRLRLAHDPWAAGDDFETWLGLWAARGPRGTLILNTKEDGLEHLATELVHAHQITDYFFLDTTVPTLRAWTNRGVTNFAVRLSEVEPIEMVERFRGRVDWVWVDCFDARPLDPAPVLGRLDSFKICLVSPELQGGDAQDLGRFKAWFARADAICTKDPSAWQNEFGA